MIHRLNSSIDFKQTKLGFSFCLDSMTHQGHTKKSRHPQTATPISTIDPSISRLEANREPIFLYRDHQRTTVDPLCRLAKFRICRRPLAYDVRISFADRRLRGRDYTEIVDCVCFERLGHRKITAKVDIQL
ncbi:unnamed protein product [Lactuca virosa]|uniref:Uncharacterized protein n=1 Tax=Lactuca virosa TaxID=75947 RepID=A0AAU9M0T5_9ASTR|nr:unnamed protein product [Lactuca virosa]